MEGTGDRLEEVQSILLVISESNDDSHLLGGLDILLKLIHNILKSPKEEKFRKIKKTNKKIAEKLLSVEGIHDLLLALEYKDESDEFYVFNIKKFTHLAKAKKLIEETYNNVRKKYMTPEELEKYERLQEYQRKVAEEQKMTKQKMDELNKGMKCDRMEKSQEEVKASRANELKFGASVTKFEPPAPARGGGG